MITRLSHSTIFVLDQEEAKAFYTEKLGFEVRTDMTMGDFRWLTVGPKSQPELELILYAIAPGRAMDAADVEVARRLVMKGALGTGVMATDDCRKTAAELKAKGVEFIMEPTDQPYGIEATFKDNSGNWFSLTQRYSMG